MPIERLNPPQLWGLIINKYGPGGCYPDFNHIQSWSYINKQALEWGTTPSKKSSAYKVLGLAILDIPIRALANVVISVCNIITIGQLSVSSGIVQNSLKGRIKSLGCSLISIPLTPLTILVDLAGKVSNCINPEDQRITLLAEHMWKGFALVQRGSPESTQ